jgi:hypothetical protein
MDAASLLLYLHDRSTILVLAGVLAALGVGLALLAYAVFAGSLTSDLSPDPQLLAPFRWWAEGVAQG